MLRKLLPTILFMAFFVSAAALAQTGSIEGTVTDAETGETVPGANVFLVDINRGAATDAEGHYEISNVEPGTYTLRVTFVGYQTYQEQVTIEANEVTEHDIQLQVGAVDLDEVVVTGYGTITRGQTTGSIATIEAEEIEKVPTQNIGTLLMANVAGVQVSTTSGNPGGGFEVKIRGIGSINAGNDPLYIVDGVQLSSDFSSIYSSQSQTNVVDPDDIASFQVLKDAAATAIYGSQAANGVVLITTKSGQIGDTRITASVERGVTTNASGIDIMEINEWHDYMFESLANTFADGSMEAGEALFRSEGFYGTFGYPSDVTFDQLQQFDWVDYVTNTGISQTYQLTAAGGDEKTTFYVSGSYEDVDGTVLDNSFKDWRLRTNLAHNVSSDFQLDLNLTLSTQNNTAICQDGNFINCPITGAYFQNPITYPFLEDGSYNPAVNFGMGGNLAVIKNEVDRETNTLRFLGNVGSTYNLTDWFSLQGLVGLEYRNIRDKRFDSRIAEPGTNGSINQALSTTANFNAQLTANLQQTFNESHNISGFVGTEYRRDYDRFFSASGIGVVPGFQVLDATAEADEATGFFTEWRLLSFFGSVMYDYEQRYILRATGRYDGSSKFGEDKQFGFFPSASGAWRISEEGFFDVPFIEELKLRAGYGVTGNSRIDNFAARYLFALSGSYQGTGGVGFEQLPNPNLTWEESVSMSVGLDFSLFNDRFGGSVDLYSTDTERLLLDRPIPADNGYDELTSNVGSIRNQGIEISLNSINLNTGEFAWTSNFNISFNKNEVLELNEGQEQIGSDFTGSYFVGQPIGVFSVPKFAGINPSDGRPLWYDADGNLTYSPTIDDRIFVSGTPDAIGGFGNTFSYKGLALNVKFEFSFGGRAFDQAMWYFMRTPAFLGNVFEYIAQDRWQTPGEVTYVPKAWWNFSYPGTADFRVTPGTHMIYDTGYIRLKNATLSYSLPPSITESLRLNGIELYITGLNLLTWTQWPGFDPEIAYDADLGGYVTAGSYPTRRVINAGIEVTF